MGLWVEEADFALQARRQLVIRIREFQAHSQDEPLALEALHLPGLSLAAALFRTRFRDSLDFFCKPRVRLNSGLLPGQIAKAFQDSPSFILTMRRPSTAPTKRPAFSRKVGQN